MKLRVESTTTLEFINKKVNKYEYLIILQIYKINPPGHSVLLF